MHYPAEIFFVRIIGKCAVAIETFAFPGDGRKLTCDQHSLFFVPPLRFAAVAQRAVTMSRIVTSPPKYHPSEWHASNSKNFQRSDIERHTSERLRAECERLRQEAEDTTARSQRDVNHKFSQRLNNIRFWKDELEEKLREIAAEAESVQDRKKELEKALHATKFPLEVAQSCLSFREQRTGVDLVHDEVEIQLMKVSMRLCLSPAIVCLNITVGVVRLQKEAIPGIPPLIDTSRLHVLVVGLQSSYKTAAFFAGNRGYTRNPESTQQDPR